MSSSGPLDATFRFGEFAADVQSGELVRNGSKVRLQGQPFEVLALLLERPGQMVTREELGRRLWPADTFVDFEHGLNAAVNRLREALGDSSEHPRFIETIPRRGYRFIAQVDAPSASGVTSSAITFTPARRFRLVFGIALLFLLVLISVAIAWWLLSGHLPRATGSTRITFSGRVSGRFAGLVAEEFPALATDGNRIYFAAIKEGGPAISFVSIAGGEEVYMPLPLEWPQLRHISPDGSGLLIYGQMRGEVDSHLWLVPTAGGGPRRLGNIDGQDGAWSPDGHRVVYSNRQDLYLADSDGRNSRKIASTPGRPFWIRWSPGQNSFRRASAWSR